MTEPYRTNAPQAQEKKISLYIYTTAPIPPPSSYSQNRPYLYFVISEDEFEEFQEATTSKHYAKKYFTFDVMVGRGEPPRKVSVNLDHVVYYEWV